MSGRRYILFFSELEIAEQLFVDYEGGDRRQTFMDLGSTPPSPFLHTKFTKYLFTPSLLLVGCRNTWMCSGLWTVSTGRRIFEGRLGEKAFEEAIAWNWLCQKTREQDQGGTSWQRELTNVKMRRADRSDWVNKKTLTINFSLQEKNGWECVFYMVHPCLIKTLSPLYPLSAPSAPPSERVGGTIRLCNGCYLSLSMV